MKKNHSKYNLKIHLIFVCKYRKKLLISKLKEDIMDILFDISLNSDFDIEIMESDLNHIHFLVSYGTKTSITSIVRRLKQLSTVRIWKKYPNYLKYHFWKEHTFWSDGYFVCSIGDASASTIENYIQTQG